MRDALDVGCMRNLNKRPSPHAWAGGFDYAPIVGSLPDTSPARLGHRLSMAEWQERWARYVHNDGRVVEGKEAFTNYFKHLFAKHAGEVAKSIANGGPADSVGPPSDGQPLATGQPPATVSPNGKQRRLAPQRSWGSPRKG